MAVVKIDVDGVIRDIFTPMLKMYNYIFNEHLSVDDITDYDVGKVFTKVKEHYGMSAAEWFFDTNGRKIFLYGKPYQGVAEAIDLLREHGHKVVIVTWQPLLENKLNTLKFLDKYGIHYDDICFTKDKWIINGDYIIDDNPEFLTEEREKAEKIVIDYPYNKSQPISCVFRGKDLKEAVQYLIK